MSPASNFFFEWLEAMKKYIWLICLNWHKLLYNVEFCKNYFEKLFSIKL